MLFDIIILMKTSSKKFRNRRLASLFVAGILAILTIFSNQNFWQNPKNEAQISENFQQISQDLENLEVKGRAPKTGYSRKQFGDGWAKDSSGCDTRNRILKRDLRETTENKKCQILTGILSDPYTDQEIQFSRAETSSAVQIDHVVALSDAWQKGAQNLSFEQRVELANDPLNLLASEGNANQQKGDSDAASWLPPNKNFRCEYISRQIRVKKKYSLWVTSAEKDAMKNVLAGC